MKKWGVVLKVTGSAYVEVEAMNESEAISLAVESAGVENLTDWDVTKNDADAEEIEGDE